MRCCALFGGSFSVRFRIRSSDHIMKEVSRANFSEQHGRVCRSLAQTRREYRPANITSNVNSPKAPKAPELDIRITGIPKILTDQVANGRPYYSFVIPAIAMKSKWALESRNSSTCLTFKLPSSSVTMCRVTTSSTAMLLFGPSIKAVVYEYALGICEVNTRELEYGREI